MLLFLTVLTMIADEEIASKRFKTQEKREELDSERECLMNVFENDRRKERNFHRRRQMLQALRVPVKINACKTENRSEVRRGLVRRGHSDDQVR